MSLIADKKFLWFVGKFLFLFAIFYFGTLAVIGLAAPGKVHSPFIQNYFDYVSWIKQSLIWAVGIITHWFGYQTSTRPDFIIGIQHGASVKIAMDCVGYGVYSFWAAYVIANDGTWKKKVGWVVGGLFLLWLINAIRISLVLMALHERIAMPLGIDHHTWFNIIAYIAIFGMIWLFERRKKPGNSNI